MVEVATVNEPSRFSTVVYIFVSSVIIRPNPGLLKLLLGQLLRQ